MTRIRTLFLLIPPVVLSQTAQVVLAAPKASTPTWAEGIYIGTISIDAHEYVALKPLPKGTLHEEHQLDILFSTGRMSIVIDNQGKMSTGFYIPLRFRYKDWSQVEDVGTGICEGQLSESGGYGTLHMFTPDADIPSGNKFTRKAQPFKVEGFNGVIVQFGEKCPKVKVETMRSVMEAGFAKMFNNDMEFEIMMTKGNIIAGYCYLPGYQLEGDHAFDCTWYVEYLTPKEN